MSPRLNNLCLILSICASCSLRILSASDLFHDTLSLTACSCLDWKFGSRALSISPLSKGELSSAKRPRPNVTAPLLPSVHETVPPLLSCGLDISSKGCGDCDLSMPVAPPATPGVDESDLIGICFSGCEPKSPIILDALGA